MGRVDTHIINGAGSAIIQHHLSGENISQGRIGWMAPHRTKTDLLSQIQIFQFERRKSMTIAQQKYLHSNIQKSNELHPAKMFLISLRPD